MNWQETLSACGVRPAVADAWAKIFSSVITDDTFSAGKSEIPDFLGQILHESAMLERLEESLNYTTADRLCAVWPKRFKSPADAAPYVRNPRGLANFVYGGRMGNTDPDDGWDHRGRGLIQCTGKDNYRAVGKAIGVDLLANPDLLAQPKYALLSAIAWWEGNIPDEAMGNVKKITRLVNGGIAGLDDRIRLANKAAKVLAA